jgi:D-alanyl-D-alanine carboxypeptidase/D-alanyl-D-alanine-endopeptidase (penicillin-binding protein 4)
MPSLLAELLARRLRTVGVEVSESRLAAAEDPVDQGRPIGPPVETALEVVVRRANTDSDNLSAESLLKRVAAHETRQPGSWTSATTAIPSVLARRITDPAALAGLVVSDGSGLSRANRITASLLTRWIAAIDADPTISSRFRESLAVGGRTGTVKNRFKDLERTGCTVYCKTGFVRGVSCLSGLVVAPDGRAMAFSILGNDLTAGNAIGDAKTLQERIVRAIADELTRHRTALGG